MKKLYLVTLLCGAFVFSANAQSVGINSDGSNPNGNAVLDLKSPGTGPGKGLLIPRITLAQRTVNNQGRWFVKWIGTII
ncbi:MAG: hypothetical protein M0D57_21930 [Sphingobacteriales bacterium JAD_PAG50586_3]|nr:MAG: hypothetical protein M0D57_21930 [Sphingobacteriales bacterium JAD_PAG50586_3]